MASISTSEVTSEEPVTPIKLSLHFIEIGFLFLVAHVQYQFNVGTRGECCNHLIIINHSSKENCQGVIVFKDETSVTGYVTNLTRA